MSAPTHPVPAAPVSATAAPADSEMFPRLKNGVRLHRDGVRDRWVILAPERMLEPDEPALAVLRLCDGVRSLADIAAALAKEYNAPPEVIAADARRLLEKLRADGVAEF